MTDIAEIFIQSQCLPMQVVWIDKVLVGEETFIVNCSRRSRRGLVQEDKRMAFVYTHGLFIT